MQQILVMNSKGGCGKTTVTTNLASYYASMRFKTAILDYDPQRSSLHWLKTRGPYAREIHAADAAPQKGGALRSLKMYISADVQRVIIDAPAGVERPVLQELVRRADCIVIPVGPSSIDIHATAGFVKDLLLIGRIRAHDTKVAVVANRVRSSMPVYEPLERFLRALDLPFLTRISDSDQYVMAAEQGLGVFELDGDEAAQQRVEFGPLIEWLDSHARDADAVVPDIDRMATTSKANEPSEQRPRVIRLVPPSRFPRSYWTR